MFKVTIVVALLTTTAVVLTAYHCYAPKPVKKNKLILTWVPFFGDPFYGFENGSPQCFKKAGCEFSDCEIVADRRTVPLTAYDALLFHGFEYYEMLFGTPNARTAEQVYIFYTVESAKRSPIPESKNDFYNLTMTYRLDSDIPCPYFTFVDKLTGIDIAPSIDPKWRSPEADYQPSSEVKEIVKKKNKTAAWFVSNCNSVSGREKFVDELRANGIQVDIFGACGNLSCPYSMQSVCQKRIGEYYFYLALENSLCDDYVTEKGEVGLSSDSIPIVYSGGSLYRFFPPNSYLNARLGAKHVAMTMKQLMANRDEYAKMFWWKSHYKLVKRGLNHEWPKGKHPLCKVCETLHRNGTTKRYEVREWWTKMSNSTENACV